MTRNDFLKIVVTFAGASALGCSDDDGDPAPAGDCTAAISANHGHTLSVVSTDLDAGQDKTYSIQGSSGHDHSITITAANFATLSGGGEVTTTSTSGGGHTHDVTISACS